MLSPCVDCCRVYNVSLTTSRQKLTLKHDNLMDIEVTVSPPNVSISSVRVEILRFFKQDRCVISRQLSTKDWKAKIAGFFNIRAVVTVCGVEHYSNPVDLEVAFPTYAQIIADDNVKRIMHSLWRQTLTYNTPGQTRELGTWMRLDTASDRYHSGELYLGPLTGQGERMLELPFPNPEDSSPDPSPCDDGADYYVASFHTHPPIEYSTLTNNQGAYYVGPSNPDNMMNSIWKVPGIVYDHLPIQTPTGFSLGGVPHEHPEEAPAGPYLSLGVDPRPTPR